MALEETLSSIDTTLKAILVALLSGNGAVAQLGEPDAKAKVAGKAKTAGGKVTSETGDAVLEGHEAGTKYWISKDGRDFYTTKPGEDQPPGDGIDNVSAAYFSAKKTEASKKVEVEKKLSDAAAQKNNAAAGPSATQKQDTASGPDFKAVVDALTTLAKAPEPKGGRAVVVGLLAKHLPDLAAAERKVPKLEALGKNAEIIAEVQALLADEPAAVVAEDDDPFA